MAFHLDTRGTKYLHNYQAALWHHDNIKPIRNRNPECRPIAERNKTHFTIRKDTDNTITVRLYTTDIATYYPPDHPTHANQIKVNLGGWNSVSTRAAIRAVAGVDITSADNKAWVRDHDGKHYLIPSEGVWLQPGEYYTTPKVLKPTYPTTHKLNRKAMNKKRAQVKPFVQHMTGLFKLIGQDAAAWQVELAGGPSIKIAEGSDLEAWSKLAKWLVWSTRKYKWTGNGHGMSFCHKRAIKELEHHIIKAYRSEVLTKETITDGRIVRDKYK